MPHHQQNEQYLMGESGKHIALTDRIEMIAKWLREWEDFLLLMSIPVLAAILLLWAIGSALGISVPAIAFVVSLLVTLLTIVAGCVLLLKWIDLFQWYGRQWLRKQNEETTLKCIGSCFVCSLVIALLLGTASSGGGDARTILLMLAFMLYGWHYRTLFRRVVPHLFQ